MYTVTTSESSSQQDERRRTQRHKPSSLIYVQLGSDNGGMVINLGMDGVACQTARKVIAKKKSTLNLRFRGSGLNAVLVGELVWLGGTQKEVGICFKDLSPGVQEDIADWIARETQACETAAGEDRPRPKPMPAMPGISARGNNLVPYRLGAALTLSHPTPADPPSSAVAGANESNLPAPSDSTSGISDIASLSAIVPPVADCSVPAEELDDHTQARSADSYVPPEQSPLEKALHSQQLFEPYPTQTPHESTAGNASTFILSEEPMHTVWEELPPVSAEPTGKSELRKTQEIEPIPVQSPSGNSSTFILSEKPIPPVREERPKDPVAPATKSEKGKTEEGQPIPQDQVSRPPYHLPEANRLERWIPPVLLVAWRRGNRQQKIQIAASAVACLAIFLLTFTLALTHIGSSLGRPEVSGLSQQPAAQQPTAQHPAATPAAASVSGDSHQAVLVQAPPARPAAAPPRPSPPQKSLLAKLAHTYFGIGPDDPVVKPEINENQLRVQVWTSKNSGFYYCTDSDFYKTVRPGAFMTQADALQSGYQPKLDDFCN